MINRIDNGNFVASQNMERISSLLNGGNRSGVHASQMLTNIGSFMASVGSNPEAAGLRAQATMVAANILSQLAQTTVPQPPADDGNNDNN